MLDMSDDDQIRRMLARTTTRLEQGVDGQQREILSIDISPPERRVERARGCWNCMHFDTGSKALAYLDDCRRRDRAVLTEQGYDEDAIKAHLGRINQSVGANIGVWGLCTTKDTRLDSGAGDDFTHHAYLCSRWTGRLVIPASEGLDKLPDELWDRLGEKPPGKS